MDLAGLPPVVRAGHVVPNAQVEALNDRWRLVLCGLRGRTDAGLALQQQCRASGWLLGVWLSVAGQGRTQPGWSLLHF